MINQRFSITDSNGKRWDYGLDMVCGYFVMDATYMNSDYPEIEGGECYTTSPASFSSTVVSDRGVIMEKLEAIGAPAQHIHNVGCDMPFSVINLTNVIEETLTALTLHSRNEDDKLPDLVEIKIGEDWHELLGIFNYDVTYGSYAYTEGFIHIELDGKYQTFPDSHLFRVRYTPDSEVS